MRPIAKWRSTVDNGHILDPKCLTISSGALTVSPRPAAHRARPCQLWTRDKTLILLLFAATTLAHAQAVYPLEGASPASAATDQQGNIYLAGLTGSTQLPVTSNALKLTLTGNSDAFVAKFSPSGELLWCTYFGGSNNDQATGVAVDPSGNVLVTGYTYSSDMPVLNAFQSTLAGRENGFVLKLDPTGKMLYSTYLGGSGEDFAAGIAVDSSGAAYITGSTSSPNFPGQTSLAYEFQGFVVKLAANGALVYSFEPAGTDVTPFAVAVDGTGSAYLAGWFQPATTSVNQGFVLKLSPDGRKVIYQTGFGGSQTNYPEAITIDSTGAAYVAGVTTSVDFPLVSPVQSTLRARPLWRSTDGGNTWAPIDNLPFAVPQTLVANPASPQDLYVAASDTGAFQSTDGGNTWTAINNGIAEPSLSQLAINPFNPAVLYTGGAALAGGQPGQLYRTTNGGASWSLLESFNNPLTAVAVDPLNPSTVYAVPNVVSTDGGNTWSALSGLSFGSQFLADPVTEGTLYAYNAGYPIFSLPAVYRSTNAGNTWQEVNNNAYEPGLAADPTTKPATIYDGIGARSNDGGKTWTALSPPPGIAQGNASAIAVNPLNGSVYAAGGSPVAIDVSTNQGQSWTLLTVPAQMPTITGITPTPGALYAVSNTTFGSAFVLKLSPDGSTILYSTYLGGHAGTSPYVNQWQNQAAGIALLPAGNIAVAGYTISPDFPTANAVQSSLTGSIDAFLSVLSPDGQEIEYSTYLGGANGAYGSALAVDPQGNLILTGNTSSTSILGTAIPQDTTVTHPPPSGFVAKFSVAAPVPTPTISKVLSAASFQAPIEAGSWVMIQGTDLANDTRLWQSSDFNGNNLPTALDGTSVTIDGIAAYVEYISPTQINVLAPADGHTGTVNIAVTNNGHASAPAQAQLQSIAPAFFMTASSNAIASLLPGYTPVTSTTPAMPGDLVVLWGTGFGPTNPAAPIGMIVSGALATSVLPVVTVGGVPVTVVSSVLTAGTAGLYQITIQLPANVPTGAPALQASIGGAQTQSSVTLLVGAR
jgi:uncharacterized protein (TIGR03437 family)